MKNHNDGKQPAIPLGKKVDYASHYQADLLFAIPRSDKRNEIAIGEELPFIGGDIWNAYELSWLNKNGLPQVAIGEFVFPASSECIVESKSLKLYLNSLNQTMFADVSDFQAILVKDLSRVAKAPVTVVVNSIESASDKLKNKIEQFDATCIDNSNIKIVNYDYSPSLLKMASNDRVEKKLCSHLLKSNCLITNQPDWASIYIYYKGRKICQDSLLEYIVSFRNHNEFHEQCIERIFTDLIKYCQPEKLTVYARYTRRGGLDINPWRSNFEIQMNNIRLIRQ